MINYDETIIDGKLIDNRINDSMTILDSKLQAGDEAADRFSETILDGSPDNSAQSADGLLKGEGSAFTDNKAVIGEGSAFTDNKAAIGEGSVLGDYRVVSRLSEGAQAKVFIAEKDGGKYVVKAYGRNWQPAKALRTFFSEKHHENVMPVLESGRELGMYYEIYPYYEEGTLEDYIQKNGALSTDFIKKYVVPSVNEGLHHLHTNNIVHCDIKPANLYLYKCGDDRRVVIGDLGSCRVMDSDGLVRSSLEGTVNYSVPVEEFYGVKTFPKEYDYASFGLTIYRLYTKSHLMENLTLDERARMWNRDIAVPVDDIRIKNLLSGLINKNFDSIWGYDELKRWSNSGWNSDRKRRTLGKRTREAAPLIFGTVEGEMLKVRTIHELVEACKSNWELATTVIKRFDTIQFIRQTDAELYKNVEKELNSKTRNDNIILFRVLYQLEKTNVICYRGENLGTLNDYLKRLSDKDELAVEFVTFDLLTYYLEIMGAGQEDIDRLDELVKLNRLNALGLNGMIDGICRAFADDQSFSLEGSGINDMNSFVDYIADKTPDEINELMRREEVQAWFIAMGFSKEMEVLKTLI